MIEGLEAVEVRADAREPPGQPLGALRVLPQGRIGDLLLQLRGL